MRTHTIWIASLLLATATMQAAGSGRESAVDAGNRPRLEARALDPQSAELRFEFRDATNLSSPAAWHTHNVTLRFLDADHLTSSWEFYEDGRRTKTEVFHYTRVR